jgi:hypothetical protein
MWLHRCCFHTLAARRAKRRSLNAASRDGTLFAAVKLDSFVGMAGSWDSYRRSQMSWDFIR